MPDASKPAYPLVDVGPVSPRVSAFWTALNTGNRPEALRLLKEMRRDKQRFKLVPRDTSQQEASKK